MATTAPPRDATIEREAEGWMNDPYEHFHNHNTRIHSLPRDEVEAVQLAAMNLRLQERRDQIQMLQKLADRGETIDACVVGEPTSSKRFGDMIKIGRRGSMTVDLVVRGADLLGSVPVQRMLQRLLGLPEPDYFHHPLVAHSDGRRLAKRDRAPTLAAMRGAGVDGPALAAQLADGRLPLEYRFIDA